MPGKRGRVQLLELPGELQSTCRSFGGKLACGCSSPRHDGISTLPAVTRQIRLDVEGGRNRHGRSGLGSSGVESRRSVVG